MNKFKDPEHNEAPYVAFAANPLNMIVKLVSAGAKVTQCEQIARNTLFSN
jgi:hypothetical protein